MVGQSTQAARREHIQQLILELAYYQHLADMSDALMDSLLKLLGGKVDQYQKQVLVGWAKKGEHRKEILRRYHLISTVTAKEYKPIHGGYPDK